MHHRGLRRGAVCRPGRGGDHARARTGSRSDNPGTCKHRRVRDPEREARTAAPGKTHVSGDPHRGERRACGGGGGRTGGGGFARSGRTGSRHYVSLARGPYRKIGVSQAFKRLHLPAGLPGVRLRRKACGAAYHPQADSSIRRGTGRKPAFSQRKAADRGKNLTLCPQKRRRDPWITQKF